MSLWHLWNSKNIIPMLIQKSTYIDIFCDVISQFMWVLDFTADVLCGQCERSLWLSGGSDIL